MSNSKNEIALVSFEDFRYGMCNVKTLNLLPNVLAANYADRNGADEAVFVRDSIVTECSHSNLFILKWNRLYTHPANILICVAKDLGIKTFESFFTLDEVKEADEVFVTSTTSFVKRCTNLDGLPLPMRCQNIANLLKNSLEKRYFDINKQS